MSCIIISLDAFANDALEMFDHQRALYKALADTHRIVVLSLHPKHEEVRWFLRREHYRYDMILNRTEESVLDDVAWKVAEVRAVKAMGWPVDYYLDVDPAAIRGVFADGTAALLLVHRLARPQWLPDKREQRSWSELVEFVEEQTVRQAAAPDDGPPKPWEQAVVP
jgi:hypothetical protein